FALAFAALIFFALDNDATDIHDGIFTAIAFLAGAVISSICAFLGMKIATKGNVRTAIRAKDGMPQAFRVAFNSGAVMGFGLAGLAVLGMMSIILIYGNFIHEKELLMEMVAGFGLGGSTVALFGRVGGGI